MTAVSNKTIGIAALTLGGLIATALALRRPDRPRGPAVAPSPASGGLRSLASRRLDQAAATLGASVLFDSAMEHYRGSYKNPAMYVPLAISALSIAASASGSRPSVPRTVAYASAGVTGLVGLGFHAYNILKRPGGLTWQNLFYAAPIGAPVALLLSGMMGVGAEQVRRLQQNDAPPEASARMARAVAAIAALGIGGTVGETWLLHFRGAFQNPGMFLPVTIPPVAALMLAGVAAERPMLGVRAVRAGLLATAALGVIGVGFHAYGVQRMMGGWRNWSQNLQGGPPMPAPPSYTGLAIAGLAALALRKEADLG